MSPLDGLCRLESPSEGPRDARKRHNGLGVTRAA